MLRSVGIGIVFVVVIVAAVPAGSPVQLSYVYSDSMEPTIGVDDGYVLVPAGEVTAGEIVTFWSPSKDAYVTHRVVSRTDAGFITKGDNNPSTDQDAGYPPVSRDRVVGEVLTLGGEPIVVPHLGTAIESVRTHLLELLAGALGAMGLYSASSASRHRRSLTRLRDVFQPLFLIGLLSITGLLAFGQPSHEITLVAVDSTGPSGGSGVIPVGSSKPVEVVVKQRAQPLLTRVVETNGLTATTQAQNATAVSVSGTVPPPASTGVVRVGITANSYPAIVPEWLLARLQAVHPLLASGASAVAVLTPFWALYHVLVDPDTPLREPPSRWRKALQRAWR